MAQQLLKFFYCDSNSLVGFELSRIRNLCQIKIEKKSRKIGDVVVGEKGDEVF